MSLVLIAHDVRLCLDRYDGTCADMRLELSELHQLRLLAHERVLF